MRSAHIRTALPFIVLVPTLCLAQAPLPIPDTLSGSTINLTVQDGTWDFHPGETVATYGINGDLLGPTIILQHGQQVTLNVSNTLPDLTTMHWHGLHVPSADDGGPHSLIYPNTTWSPSFTVMDRASTFWYHPHSHGLTDYQVSMGLAGMIIVRDTLEAALLLPRTYGVDDIPLILQTKAIVNGQIAMHTGLDSVVLVNGASRAVASLPAQVVRLRCLNGASERTFMLGFDNGMTFHVIGTDGGLLAAPVPRTRLQLMPGERVELLVDLTSLEGSTFHLMAYNSELADGIIGGPLVGDGVTILDGYAENALNGADFPMLSFAVGAPTADPVASIPTTLVPTGPYAESDADNTRNFVFEPQGTGAMELIEGPFTMNGAVFNMDVVNETVELGATEIWAFVNNTMVGHPIHMHDIQFNILDRNGLAPEDWESGWKDVVYVPAMGSARVITRFEDFADPGIPYMYHCHLLMHEDEGMMGQFVVVDPSGMNEAGKDRTPLLMWPQPWNSGPLSLRIRDLQGTFAISLLDASARNVYQASAHFFNGRASIHPPELAPGAYILRMVGPSEQVFSTKLIVQP